MNLKSFERPVTLSLAQAERMHHRPLDPMIEVKGYKHPASNRRIVKVGLEEGAPCPADEGDGKWTLVNLSSTRIWLSRSSSNGPDPVY